MAGRLLANAHDRSLVLRCPSDYYALNDLRLLGMDYEIGGPSPKAYEINESNYLNHLNGEALPRECILRGYFEDFNFFIRDQKLLKSWLPDPSNIFEGLTIHFRTGDRLFYKQGWDHKTNPSQWQHVITKINPDKIRIVTDFPTWKSVSKDELQSMSFHVDVPNDQRVDPSASCDYINSMIHMFNEFKPASVLHQSIEEDFYSIRDSRQILFEHGTLSWWAAFLSTADEVHVYGPWRAWKNDGNRNLSQLPLGNWYTWS